MPIFLTGDLHNWINNKEQKCLKAEFGIKNEITILEEWLNIVKKNNLKATVFVTGIFAKENNKRLREIFKENKKLIEFGGHTYSAFRPNILFYFLKLTSGKRYGYYFYQKRDIRKTLEEIRKITGRNVCSWKTHEYNSDSSTLRALQSLGIRLVCENNKNKKIFNKFKKLSYIEIDIPDHEKIKHPFESSAFKISSHEWFKTIRRTIELNERRHRNTVILAHPSCMKSIDNFKTFGKLCKYLTKFKSVCLKDYE